MKKEKRHCCLNLFTDDFEKFKKLCAERLSNVSREISILIKEELKREGVQKCSNNQ